MSMSSCNSECPKWRVPVRLTPIMAVCLGLALSLAWTGCDLPGFGGDSTPPDPPSGLSADSEDSAIVLDWQSVQSGDLDGYNVYRSTSSIASTEGRSPVNGEDLASGTNYTDDTVQNGTTYYYVVTALDDAGNESEPSGETQKTPFADPPDRP